MAPRGRSRSRSRSRSRERKERKERRKREKERDAEDQRAAARRAAPAPAAARRPPRRTRRRRGASRRSRASSRARSGAAARAVVAGGKSLGDDGGEEELDAEAWVKRSRAAPALAKLEAERRSRLLFEQDRSDYDAGDLEGLGVAAHSAAVGRGEELILTLADEQILDYDEGKHGKLVGLRKGSGGTLVNQERAESAKREGTLADRRDERLLHAGGTATDDWEFDGGGAVAGAGGPLAKYDARAPRGAKLVIGAGGVVSVADQAHLSGAAIARLAETLGDGRSGAELGADGDAGESLKTGGKWNASAVDGAGFAAQRDYLTADEAAKLFKKKAKKRRGKGSGRKALAEPTTGGVLDGLEAADDGGDRGPSPGRGRAPADADALVFTSTTEFTARLHARLEERAAENAEASAEAAADALAAAGGAAVKAEAGELPPDESDSDAMSDSDDESLAAAEAEDRGDLIDFLHKQPLARDGMAATMGLLRQTGDVQIKHVEQKVGRARDQTIFEDGTEDDPAAPPDPSLQFKPIKLEYRDADGRLLTRKEAFRQMCHKFHGKGAGQEEAGEARTGQAFVPINNQTAYAAMGQPKEKSKSKKKKKKAKGH
ncbi:hypothetical protein JL722_2854 [Aureococcus anophagefferens]|nr:hypothetical protein JL722_2854 [Aureococcus anophagefferens]